MIEGYDWVGWVLGVSGCIGLGYCMWWLLDHVLPNPYDKEDHE